MSNQGADGRDSRGVDARDAAGRPGRAASVLKVLSPVRGQVIPLERVNDAVFAAQIMGTGVAIVPEDSTLYSPVNGMVSYIPESRHALLLVSDDGVELLIHVGIDTVRLRGRLFTTAVRQGDRVSTGDPLLHFDLKAIANLGYDVTIPVVVTNSGDYAEVRVVGAGGVDVSDQLIDILGQADGG